MGVADTAIVGENMGGVGEAGVTGEVMDMEVMGVMVTVAMAELIRTNSPKNS